MSRSCIFAQYGCENTVKDKSKLQACTTCRASINRWSDRPAVERSNYIHRLERYHARMETVTSDQVIDLKKVNKQEALRVEKQARRFYNLTQTRRVPVAMFKEHTVNGKEA